MSKLHICVTGGAGYIGSNVVQMLLDKDYQVTVIDDLSTGFQSTVQQFNLSANFEFIKQDLSIWQAVQQIFANNQFDAVIHFAANIVVSESVKLPIDYYLNNTANTANLIKVCIENKVNKFIFSSTAAVYQELPTQKAYQGLTEQDLCQPINPYGWSKLFSEQIIQDAQIANPDLKYIILRYFNVAGSNFEKVLGQKNCQATHLIKRASQVALNSEQDCLKLFGDDYNTEDGTCIRDYIHILDLADAHLKALDYLEQNSSDIFNCGYGYGYSVKQVIQTMKEVTGVDFKIVTESKREGDSAILIADSEKIKSKMNWQPQYDNLAKICKSAYEFEKLIQLSFAS